MCMHKNKNNNQNNSQKCILLCIKMISSLELTFNNDTQTYILLSIKLHTVFIVSKLPAAM